MKKIAPLCFLIGICLVQSCKVCHDCPENLAGLNTSSFPAVVNDHWVYQVTDSTAHVVDTATFTITSMASSNSDSTVYKTQTTVGNIVTDSGTLFQTTNSFTYRPSGTQSLFEFLKLVYPIQINGAWQGYYSGDSLHVISAGISQNVLGSTYGNTFELGRYYLTPAYAVQATIFLTPNVGIIEEGIQVNTQQNSSIKTLKLISYSLH